MWSVQVVLCASMPFHLTNFFVKVTAQRRFAHRVTWIASWNSDLPVFAFTFRWSPWNSASWQFQPWSLFDFLGSNGPHHTHRGACLPVEAIWIWDTGKNAGPYSNRHPGLNSFRITGSAKEVWISVLGKECELEMALSEFSNAWGILYPSHSVSTKVLPKPSIAQTVVFRMVFVKTPWLMS